MNKTAVKETARERGPHLRPARTTYPIAASFPLPGPQNCLPGSATSFTAYGNFDTTQINSIDAVELIVSVVNNSGRTTRAIKGNLNITGGNWNCQFDKTVFPLQADNYMPAVLIVRGTTTQGGTVILYVPFSHDPAA